MSVTEQDGFVELYRWLKPQLRRLCRRWKPYYSTLNKAKSVEYIPSSTGQKQLRRVFFKCAICKGAFPRKNVNVDHILPVVDTALGDGKPDFNELIFRMFCDASNLQITCKECHAVKSKKEREERKAAKGNSNKRSRVSSKPRASGKSKKSKR